MARILFVLHDPPYGTERVFNGLRWADSHAKNGDEVKIFCFGDSVIAAVQGQQTPNGYYNTGKQITGVVRKGGEIGLCATCMDARGLSDDSLLDGAHRSSMQELTAWTSWADKVINV
ncbi:DsrE/DsrF/TusD sulfur relay family protein [Leucobacter chromiireducens]|uniref:DsrE/DsrF/TusD sulfur relay family protein n=1 Tax=Leucobacter chromiireducens TaxID=283877 RepID=UPI003F7FE5AF